MVYLWVYHGLPHHAPILGHPQLAHVDPPKMVSDCPSCSFPQSRSLRAVNLWCFTRWRPIWTTLQQDTTRIHKNYCKLLLSHCYRMFHWRFKVWILRWFHILRKVCAAVFFHGFPGMFQATNGRIGRVPSNKQQQNPTNCCPAASWHKPSRSPTARPPCRMSWKVWVKGGIHFKKNGRNLPRKFGQSWFCWSFL